ncbi:4-hydroxythreonine-4-phosphate dehydrogenase, partial [Novimethylophilus kurashikiensis]
NGLTTSEVAALTTAQIVSLKTAQFEALTTSQIGALSTADIIALTTSQVASLTTDQIASGLTTSQVAAITTTQIMALTTTQIGAFTTVQMPLLQSLSSPIALDLNGDGLKTLGISAGVQFDLNAIGQKAQTGWISSEDGLLVLDRNHDGVINDGGELFGTSTLLSDGQKAANGYVALTELDTNGDGVISAADSSYDELKVWIDANSDGVNEAGELVSLGDLGISKLNLSASSTSVIDNGNWIGMVSSYETIDGTTHEMADVWFLNNQSSATSTVDLSSQVSSLTQAITAFSEATADTSVSSATTLTDNQTTSTDTAIATSVSSLTTTLSQYDANGSILSSTTSTAVAVNTSSITDGLTNTQTTTPLATGGGN